MHFAARFRNLPKVTVNQVALRNFRHTTVSLRRPIPYGIMNAGIDAAVIAFTANR